MTKKTNRRKFSIALVGVLFSGVIQKAMAHEDHTMANDTPPLIESDPNPPVATPSGYRAYVLRDWNRYMVAAASSVASLDDDRHVPGEAYFDFVKFYVIRPPKFVGEVSHIFLPASYVLPPEIRALRAKPIPVSLPSYDAKPISFKFQEETPPPGAPTGSRAYFANLRTIRYTGTVTGITPLPGGGFKFAAGSKVRVRMVRAGDDPVSHIIVPPGSYLPKQYIESSP